MTRRSPRSAPLPQVIRVVIVDDHELTRAGLASMLQGERDIEIVGDASGGRRAITMCRRLKPDVVFMDIRMPDMDGLDATRAIKRYCPETDVIIVTILDQAEYLKEAVRAGAAGYLLKDAAKGQILFTLRQVRRKVHSFPPEVLEELAPSAASSTPPSDTGVPEHLSRRQREVLRLLVRGHSNPEIASMLQLSLSTVKTHVEHILDKLKVSHRSQAAAVAIEMRLLEDGVRG